MCGTEGFLFYGVCLQRLKYRTSSNFNLWFRTRGESAVQMFHCTMSDRVSAHLYALVRLHTSQQSSSTQSQQQLRPLFSCHFCFVFQGGGGFLKHKQPSQSLIFPEASPTCCPDLFTQGSSSTHCNMKQETHFMSSQRIHHRSVIP